MGERRSQEHWRGPHAADRSTGPGWGTGAPPGRVVAFEPPHLGCCSSPRYSSPAEGFFPCRSLSLGSFVASRETRVSRTLPVALSLTGGAGQGVGQVEQPVLRVGLGPRCRWKAEAAFPVLFSLPLGFPSPWPAHFGCSCRVCGMCCSIACLSPQDPEKGGVSRERPCWRGLWADLLKQRLGQTKT